MSHNPFGGFSRPDKLDPWMFLKSGDQPEKAILLAVILDAVFNYLYFGLGDEAPDGSPRGNGTSVENFFCDHQYLFVVRSTLRETWEHARRQRGYCEDENGVRRLRTLEFSDDLLKFMTFDCHYAAVGLQLPMETFLDYIREHRKTILQQNAQQIREFIELMRTDNLARVHIGPLFAEMTPINMRVLLDPQSPDEVSDLVYYVPKGYHERRPRERFIPILRPERLIAADAARIILRMPEGPLYESAA